MRLNEQGISASHLATPGLLKMIVAQQLYPQACQHCARPLTQDENVSVNEFYTKKEQETLRTVEHDLSCKACHGSGVTGRKVYAEIIKIDKQGRNFIRNMDIRGWEEYLRKNGYVGLDERVRHDIINGNIDVFSIKAMDPPEIDCFKYNEDGENA